MCVHPTATVLYSEIYMAGRKHFNGGELFKFDILSVCSHGERPDGEQLFREKFIIRPQGGHIRDCGVMGTYDVFANYGIPLSGPAVTRKCALTHYHVNYGSGPLEYMVVTR